ncbi:MAG TPA: hypothetical protein VHT53_08555 [Candidatus Elarobacter sp.]|jgi:hypothetical protein|nr:hypothetical protein [Candidatus Elarobacter sp.]
MLPAVVVALVALSFQPVTAENTAQPAHVFVRDSAAPPQLDPAAGAVHDAGVRPFGENDPPSAQLTNAHGDSIRASVAEWRAATGMAELAPASGGGTAVRARFRGLVPMGRYSLFVRQLAGRAGIVLTPVDIVGASNTFFADRDGVGGITVESPNAIPSGAQLVLIYHSDGAGHQSSPGNLGVTAHEQLITRVP